MHISHTLTDKCTNTDTHTHTHIHTQIQIHSGVVYMLILFIDHFCTYCSDGDKEQSLSRIAGQTQIVSAGPLFSCMVEIKVL